MSDLAIALAGGAVGAVLAWLFAQAGRAWAAWGGVTLHDDEARERNRRLAVWVDDRTHALVIECKQRAGRLSAAGQRTSGSFPRSMGHAKSQALHEYRDQEEQARIDLAAIRAKEGGWHWVWRKVRGRPPPSLTARAQVEPFLERWRTPITGHGGPPYDVLDRTKRTLDDALAELPSIELP